MFFEYLWYIYLCFGVMVHTIGETNRSKLDITLHRQERQLDTVSTCIQFYRQTFEPTIYGGF